MEIKGKYVTAIVHTDNVEQAALEQIQQIVDCPAFEGQSVHYMPDVHAGMNCTVGFTAGLGEYVNPLHIGSDIGCMVSHMVLSNMIPVEKYADFEHKVRQAIPHDIQKKSVIDERDFFKFLSKQFNRMKQQWPEHLSDLPDTVTEKWVSDQLKRLNMDKAMFYKQLGTYSSAVSNHFIEYGCNDEKAGITVHCGSRNFGQKVCRRWESVAQRSKQNLDGMSGYLSGNDLDGYLCDMCFAQAYAEYNHRIIHHLIGGILSKYSIKVREEIYCPHNYIDMNTHIIHKGSISAMTSETVVIPFNMRDGIAICKGKSNPDWNFSGPHGAGRIMSRNQAKKNISLDDYTATMKDVYSTSVCNETIDESPMAYKPTEEIKTLIVDTVDILYMLPSKINIKATKPQK